MKCKEIKRLAALRNSFSASMTIEINRHIENCRNCRDHILVESMTKALLKSHVEREHEAISPFLTTRIMSRIRDLSEHRISTWENAILSLRGWVLTLGAFAILLLTIGITAGQLDTLEKKQTIARDVQTSVNAYPINGQDEFAFAESRTPAPDDEPTK